MLIPETKSPDFNIKLLRGYTCQTTDSAYMAEFRETNSPSVFKWKLHGVETQPHLKSLAINIHFSNKQIK